jgi:hypothetical protein
MTPLTHLAGRLALILIIAAIVTATYTACNMTACPDCSESNCIYQEINNTVKCDTDECIQDAVIKVCIRRNVTDSATIKNILANFYL